MVGVGPGTPEKPLITDEGNVIVRGEAIERVTQLPHNKRWVVIRLSDGRVSNDSWKHKELAIDALRERFGVEAPR